ncbi:MAG TPA: hypothetical protein VN114_09320 [Oxalicibacterium sp.]|nr:hypothetical protein [Oxalicibacterium sp.]HWU98700.1 hypothetical protein [Oxalicibacterium sp.]
MENEKVTNINVPKKAMPTASEPDGNAAGEPSVQLPLGRCQVGPWLVG